MASRKHNLGGPDKHRRAAKLWELQGGLCAYCARQMLHPDQAREWLRTAGCSARPSDPTIEHLTPRGSSGSNALTNLVLAHYRCNHERDRAPIPERVRLVWKANCAAMAIERGEREPVKACAACELPHMCEAQGRCDVAEKVEAA